MTHRRWLGTVLASALVAACAPAAPSAAPTASFGNPPSAAPTAAPTPSSTPVATPRPAAAGRILFESSFRDPKHTIFEMDPDGSNVVALPNGPKDDEAFWSPDHQLIAFVRSDLAPEPGIY